MDINVLLQGAVTVPKIPSEMIVGAFWIAVIVTSLKYDDLSSHSERIISPYRKAFVLLSRIKAILPTGNYIGLETFGSFFDKLALFNYKEMTCDWVCYLLCRLH